MLDFGSVIGSFGDLLLPGSSSDWDTSQLLVDGTLEFVGGSMGDGDFNGDGAYDCLDINALTSEIAGGENDIAFDLTGDGMVNLADRDAWLAEAGSVNLASGNPYRIGDGNLDGVVDVSDFNIWNNNKFTTQDAWCNGDFNADGLVDVSDFNLWNNNKFQSSDTLVVPEPHAICLLLIGMMAVALRAKRRRS